MGAITIRRVDDGVIARLKADAKQHGRSMEEEARMALSQVYPPTLHGQAAVDHLDALRRKVWGGVIQPDSTPLIRELREEDPAAWSGK